MVNKQTIGKKIKEIRERQQLQQIDIASKIHMSQSNLAKYEAGINLPSILTLIEIAKVCEASLDEFILDEAESTSKVLISVTLEESRLINKYRSLQTEKQEALLTLLNLK